VPGGQQKRKTHRNKQRKTSQSNVHCANNFFGPVGKHIKAACFTAVDRELATQSPYHDFALKLASAILQLG